MLLIHIGFRKTGSSTIQHFLGLNAGRLARSGVDYPDAGRIGWAHNGLREELQADGDLSQWRAVRDLAAAGPDRVTVVSCEGFDLLQAAQVARLAVLLAGLEVRILAYIRDPAGWAVSFYGQQTLKAGNVLDFDALFERLKGHGRLRAGERLAPWAEVFGWQALRVRSLDPRSLAGGDLLDDLLDAVGLPGADPDHALPAASPARSPGAGSRSKRCAPSTAWPPPTAWDPGTAAPPARSAWPASISWKSSVSTPSARPMRAWRSAGSAGRSMPRRSPP